MTQHKGVRLPAAMWEPVNECKSVLVCLPYQGLRALLALSERLEWKTTWIDQSGKQQDLTDLQWALVDATIGGLNCPMCMDDLLAALTGIKDAIENQELSLDVNALVAAVNGVQTAIEQQEMTVNVDLDLASLVTAINGVQTAIEEQEISIGDLTLDLSDIVTVLTTIRSSLDNQTNEMVTRLFELRIGLSDHLAIINQTLQSLEMGEVNVDLSGLEAALTAIRTAIENLSEEEMAIINNVCCGGCGGCGCGGGGQMPPILPPDVPPGDISPPLPPIPPYDPIPPTFNFRQFTCNYSHLSVYSFRLLIMELTDLVPNAQLNYERALVIWDRYMLGLLGYGASLAISKVIEWGAFATAYLSGIVTNQLIAAIDAKYNEFICALYSSDGAEAKRAGFLAVVDSLNLPWTHRYWIKLLLQETEFHKFYREDWATFQFPPTHQQPRQCPCGDENDVIPTLPESDDYEYILTPMTFSLTQGPPDSNNIVLSSEDYPYGKSWSVLMQRSATLARANASIACTMTESRQSILERYGGGWHSSNTSTAFVGIIVHHDQYVQSPTSPLLENRFEMINNFVVSVENWLNGGKTLLLHEGQPGTQFLVDGGLAGYTVLRNMTHNVWVTQGALPSLPVNLRTFEEATHRKYHVVKFGIRFAMAIWRVPKQ